MADLSTASAATASARPPAVLQVLPALVSGGVERGTLQIAEALVLPADQASALHVRRDS